MKRIALISGLSILICAAVCSTSCSVDSAASQGAPTEMEKFVVQTIIDEEVTKAGIKPAAAEGTVIAHVTAVEGRDDLLSPTRVWVYTQGQLVEATAEEFRKAVSSNRSDWPPYTFAFTVESGMGNRKNVIIRTLYNTSKVENGRAGNEQSWELNNLASGWTVGDKDIQISWD